jgi:hypothetical protein
MAESIDPQVETEGRQVAKPANQGRRKAGAPLEDTADWPEKPAHGDGDSIEEGDPEGQHPAQEVLGSTAAIKEHMVVYGACGNAVGRVDRVEGDRIKLTKDDSPDGQHHFIPASWVARVDEDVHLGRDCDATRSEWQTA